MQLIPANLEAPEGLEAFLLELGDGESGFGGTDYQPEKESLEDFLRRLVDVARGVNLRPGWVPSTTFWLLDGAGQIAGMSRLRHRLNPDLLNHGGHIGYYVRLGSRGHGYGTTLLGLTLAEGRRLGIERFLLTVRSSNSPSIRVIEANGGMMEDERLDDAGQPFRRYWIA
jgi:predicted acetyltransferase